MNPEVIKYLQKASDCLSDAAYLLDGSRLEASCNRSYYAIFDAIQAILVSENITTKTHQGTHNKFRELFIKTKILPSELNEILSESFNSRQGSDYENDFEISVDDTTRILKEANWFVEVISEYLRKDDSKN